MNNEKCLTDSTRFYPIYYSVRIGKNRLEKKLNLRSKIENQLVSNSINL